MGQCCAKCCACCGDSKTEPQGDSEWSPSRNTRKDYDETEDEKRDIDDNMEGRRDEDMEDRRDDNVEDRRDDYTENDPLLPKVGPPAHRYLLQPTAPPLYANESHDDDINERTTEVMVPSYESEHGDLYNVEKHARHDPHAVVQLEPPRPAQHETYHPAQAASHSREYNLYQDVQEREPHYPIQEESPTSAICLIGLNLHCLTVMRQ